MNTSKAYLDPNGKLSLRERAGYSLGGYGMNITYSLTSAFLLVYYVSVAKADPLVAANVIAISKIFDGISDLLMGWIVDHTNSKAGKARPWILRLCLPLAVCTFLMFSAPESFQGAALTAWMFITYNLVNTIFYTGMSVSYNSLNGFMTLVQYERGLLGNLQFIMSTAATMTLNTLLLRVTRFFGGGEQYTYGGWRIAIAIFMGVAIVCNLLCYLLCRERVTESLRVSGTADDKTETTGAAAPKASTAAILKGLFTNRYWLIMLLFMFMLNIMMSTFFGTGVYFAQYRLNNADLYSPIANGLSFAQIAIMFVTPFLMVKLSKKNLCVTGLVVTAFGFIATHFVTGSTALLIITSVIKGIGFGMTAAPMYGMLQDTITYGEWKNGISATGMGNAAASFGQKIGSGVGTAALGWILAAGHFTEDPTSASALASINVAFIWLPAICTLVTFVAMMFYDLDNKYARIASDLAAGRHMADEK